jgi:hypothetical protein
VTIPLASAFLCCNCDTISDSLRSCPKCGETISLLSLSAILNRAVSLEMKERVNNGK